MTPVESALEGLEPWVLVPIEEAGHLGDVVPIVFHLVIYETFLCDIVSESGLEPKSPSLGLFLSSLQFFVGVCVLSCLGPTFLPLCVWGRGGGRNFIFPSY